MSVIASITNIREPKSCNNLVSEFMTFNEPHLYTISDGVGNVEVSNSDEYPIYGERSQKIRFLTNLPATFNSGGDYTNGVAPRTGQYCICWELQKNDPDADVTYTAEVTVNGTLTSSRTVVGNAYSTSGFVDGQVNTFYTFFYMNADDEFAFAWTTQCDTVDTVIYVDGFGLFFNDKALQSPPFYVEPKHLVMKFQQRTDFTNTQTLDANIETDFAFIGTSVIKNTPNDILDIAGFSVPTKVDTMITRVAQFTAVVPSGGSKHIIARLLVNSVVVREEIHAFVRTDGSDEPVHFMFKIPTDATLLANQCKIVLEPNASTVIKLRDSLHEEILNP